MKFFREEIVNHVKKRSGEQKIIVARIIKSQIYREIKAEDQRSKSVSHWREFLLLSMLRPKG